MSENETKQNDMQHALQAIQERNKAIQASRTEELRGPAGARGEKGEPGISGPAGPKGDRGPIGPAGPQGERGPHGVVGKDGTRGDIGPEGLQGATGLRGPVGPEGRMGPAGPEGKIGPAGPDGSIGPTGEKGDKGDPGMTRDEITAIMIEVMQQAGVLNEHAKKLVAIRAALKRKLISCDVRHQVEFGDLVRSVDRLFEEN